MTQKEQVLEAMKKNNGLATFNELYELIDFSTWKTKTPHASVRQIVQINKEFFKIKPGLWGLKAKEKEIREMIGINNKNEFKNKNSKHDYYQGTIVSIGNMRKYKTFIPAQDKNKLYLGKEIGQIASLRSIENFAYDSILKKAKTVDIIWFNDRKMPNSFFEIENTTNFTESLDKFYELQDFYAQFHIVAPKERRREFESKISRSIYSDINTRVKFVTYDEIDKQMEYDKDKVSFI